MKLSSCFISRRWVSRDLSKWCVLWRGRWCDTTFHWPRFGLEEMEKPDSVLRMISQLYFLRNRKDLLISFWELAFTEASWEEAKLHQTWTWRRIIPLRNFGPPGKTHVHIKIPVQVLRVVWSVCSDSRGGRYRDKKVWGALNGEETALYGEARVCTACLWPWILGPVVLSKSFELSGPQFLNL